MAECPGTATCPFFTDNMANMPSTAGALKRMFCLGTFNRCARFIVKEALGKPAVPPDLMPADSARANRLLKEAGRALPT